ncbi:hypothetical protein ACM1TL_01705 [Lysinibacillus capsici]|uniref:Uncharacterized protein n=2 Tax=Lysinibacillus capsici TaxID=2115968 RepID=A0ABY8KHJ8_9BACI|nr:MULTISPECIES: hypothetical protein [Lysinibacillus]MDP1393919.1 hypothetical protein [Lysinibacillus capsici]MDP1414695.1 hypothetical protein [Lysinibacillus capsici]MDP1430588.1 hypothetical protein [Lysinibacillus capsici]MEC1301980.1 hypothetical protein [Lysinibacillus capsici]MED3799751.1 hypothetical protein [Lysinibacillus capsici]
MKLSTILNFVILIFFTLLFVNDFFPDTAIAAMLTKKIILLILVGLVIIQLAFDKGRYKRLSKKAYIGLTLYTVGLWIVLTLLGGQSQIGLSFTSPLFYIIVVLLGLDLIRLSRQTKRDQTEEKAK